MVLAGAVHLTASVLREYSLASCSAVTLLRCRRKKLAAVVTVVLAAVSSFITSHNIGVCLRENIFDVPCVEGTAFLNKA